MVRRSRVSQNACRLLFGGILLSTAAFASVMAVGPDAFPSGSPVLTFEDLAIGTEVNGLSYKGVLFTSECGGPGVPCPNIVDNLDGTNSINLVGEPISTLTLALPESVTLFGFRYGTFPFPGPTISLFSGATPLGAVFYGALFGFAGIESTIPFDTVALNFVGVNAFVDDVRFATTASVPEPSTILLVVVGLLLCFSSQGFTVLGRRAAQALAGPVSAAPVAVVIPS
ncbi:MAG: PEP-CTERM sorting domain-containing protein [Bryobacteraceae bacterium]